jgi:hypothetical protein
MAIDPVTGKLLMEAASTMNPAAMAGSAILGGIQLVGGYRNLAKANKMADPSFMSGAGEIKQQQARYGRLYDTGISTGQEDMMREKFRSNIAGIQQKFRETSRQGSTVFSRLAGLNVNEGERAIMEADIQQRNMGLRGLGSTAESLTNIAMRDIGTTKEDKRRAIAAAGAAISKGYENIGSAINFMGMTKGQGGQGGQGSSLPEGTAATTQQPYMKGQYPLSQEEYFNMGTPFGTRFATSPLGVENMAYAPGYSEPPAPSNTYGFSPNKLQFNYTPVDFNAGYSPKSTMFKK